MSMFALLALLQVSGGLQPAAPAKATGNFHALIVGLNSYRDPKLNLSYATPDATLLHKAVMAAGQNGALLTDENATRAAILDRIDATLQSAKAGDFFLVYFAGHGVIQYNDFYFLPHEATSTTVFSAGITASSLVDALSTAVKRDVSVLLILDACHSGSFGFDIARYYGGETQRAGIGLFFASGPTEFAVESSELGHGLFTYFMAEALAGASDTNNDALVSLRELVDYTTLKVKQQTGDVQNPVYIGTLPGKAAVVWKRGASPKPEPATRYR